GRARPPSGRGCRPPCATCAWCCKREAGNGIRDTCLSRTPLGGFTTWATSGCPRSPKWPSSACGGILDVYGFGMAAPARLEWWGDEIESLRTFDLDSQRSGEAIERVTVLPVKTEGGQAGDVGAQHAAPLPRQSLLDLLPSDALTVLEQESALGQEVERAWS